MKKIKLYLLLTCLCASWQTAEAVIYKLPNDKGRIVGQNFTTQIAHNSKLPLEAFAAEYQMGLSNMLEANPGVDVYLPTPGATLLIPHQLILPDAPHEGIIINSAEMRLYYYPKKSKKVVVLPIGIGQLGKDTPMDWVTSVQDKRINPTWTPTKAMHQEYIANGLNIPDVFPAGPDNPMGLYALYIGRLYAIHGTNADFGIGLRVSHGCVRLRASDIEWLYNHVPVGTRVQFINQPIKMTVEPDGSLYLEVHNPLSTTEEQLSDKLKVPLTLPDVMDQILRQDGVDQEKVQQVLDERMGIPIKIGVVKKEGKEAKKNKTATANKPNTVN